MTTKDTATFITAATAGASAFAAQLGGWDGLLVTLLCIMGVDILLGSFLSIIGMSDKTESGKFRSSAFVRGGFKRCALLVMIFVGHRLDLSIDGVNWIADAIIMFCLVYELSSVVESLQKLGLPIPKVLTDIIEFLKSKIGEGEKAETEKNDNEKEGSNTNAKDNV